MIEYVLKSVETILVPVSSKSDKNNGSIIDKHQHMHFTFNNILV